MGGSRGLANMLRQHSQTINIVTAIPATSAESESKHANSHVPHSPTPNRNLIATVPATPPPPLTTTVPAKPPPPLTTTVPATPPPPLSTTSASDESKVIKNNTFDKPPPPPRRASVIDVMPSITSGETKPTQDIPLSQRPDVFAVTTLKPYPTPSPGSSAPAISPSKQAPPQAASVVGVVRPQTNDSVATSTVIPSTKKGNIAIGGKAGGVYAEASYIGDGDEVDDSEW